MTNAPIRPVVLCVLDGWGTRATREANAPARALYARLGFVEELTLVPLRKGFTLP